MIFVKTGQNKIEESNLNIVNAPSPGEGQVARETRLERAYCDLPGLRHETKDVLKALQANLLQLEDLSGRLGFVLGDVRSVIRR